MVFLAFPKEFVRSLEKCIPNRLNCVSPQHNLCDTFSILFEVTSLPIQISLVFSLLILSLEISPNISKMFTAACKQFGLPSKIILVSSANCVSLNIVLSISNPRISGDLLIRQHNIDDFLLQPLHRLCWTCFGMLWVN